MGEMSCRGKKRSGSRDRLPQSRDGIGGRGMPVSRLSVRLSTACGKALHNVSYAI